MNNNQKESEDNYTANATEMDKYPALFGAKTGKNRTGLKVDEVFKRIQTWRRENRQQPG